MTGFESVGAQVPAETEIAPNQSRIPDGLTNEQIARLWYSFGDLHHVSVVSPLLCDVESVCGQDATLILDTSPPDKAVRLYFDLKLARLARIRNDYITYDS